MYFFLSIMLLTKLSTENSVLYYLSGQHELIPLILTELEILSQVLRFVLVFLWGFNYAYYTWDDTTDKYEVHGPNCSNTQELDMQRISCEPNHHLDLLHPAMLTAAWLMSLHPLHLGIPPFETTRTDAISFS